LLARRSDAAMDRPLLQIRAVRKCFGEVVVLDGVDLDIHAGEVHAVVGENGAGKSTLMRIAAGIHAPDAGNMDFCGRSYAPKSPADGLRSGIAMVHQELSLAADLTVAENILAGLEPLCWRWFVDRKRLLNRAAAMLAEFCPSVDPRATVASLGMGYRQMVEIVKSLAWNPKVIIFDEPTSALEAHETGLVLQAIRKLAAKAVGVVYISHRMDEVFRISDRITVLRDGARVGEWATAKAARETIVHAMVGREIAHLHPKQIGRIGEVLLSVAGLTSGRNFHDVSFCLHRGEILGFSGLVGSGRTELMRAIFGADRLDKGTILLDGHPRRFRSVGEAVRAGIAYVPEDRKTQGLFLEQSLEDNIVCGNLGQCSWKGIVLKSLCRKFAESYCHCFQIKARGLEQEIRTLSGGNQQKALLARWSAALPKVFIVDEPTRGIDVGAKSEIHRLLRLYADAGNGVIVVSSEMPELLGICDRILVMHEGRLAGELAGSAATEEALIHMALGSWIPPEPSTNGVDS
jgi:ABC-type sugar transport system ATPase subunit